MEKRKEAEMIYKAKVRKERETGETEHSLSYAINHGFSLNTIKRLNNQIMR